MSVEPFRRSDPEARQVYAETDRDPAGLAAARIGVEHVDHHGRALRHAGTSYVGDTITHRFYCTDRGCPFTLSWSTTA